MYPDPLSHLPLTFQCFQYDFPDAFLQLREESNYASSKFLSLGRAGDSFDGYLSQLEFLLYSELPYFLCVPTTFSKLVNIKKQYAVGRVEISFKAVAFNQVCQKLSCQLTGCIVIIY